MTEIAKGRRVLTTSDSLTNIHGLGKEHSAKNLAKISNKKKNKDYQFIFK